MCIRDRGRRKAVTASLKGAAPERSATSMSGLSAQNRLRRVGYLGSDRHVPGQIDAARRIG
eukprot:381347-Rhodomonas_salina.1